MITHQGSVVLVHSLLSSFHLPRAFKRLICTKRSKAIMTKVAPIIQKYSVYVRLALFPPGQPITLITTKYISNAMLMIFILFIF
ncbi:hypothetical protein M2133_000519 [Parabacteroides sp. PF5-6]|nr:hypothetical protein [Parabacteroides sp. PF5-6]